MIHVDIGTIALIAFVALAVGWMIGFFMGTIHEIELSKLQDEYQRQREARKKEGVTL